MASGPAGGQTHLGQVLLGRVLRGRMDRGRMDRVRVLPGWVLPGWVLLGRVLLGRVLRGRAHPEPGAHRVLRALATPVATTSAGGLASVPGVPGTGGPEVVLGPVVPGLVVLELVAPARVALPTGVAMIVVRGLDPRVGPSEHHVGRNRRRPRPSFAILARPERVKRDPAPRRRCAWCAVRGARRRRRPGEATRT